MTDEVSLAQVDFGLVLGCWVAALQGLVRLELLLNREVPRPGLNLEGNRVRTRPFTVVFMY